MDITSTLALSMGAAWASGINLYAAVFMLGYLGSAGQLDLPPELQILTSPMVMAAAGFMYCVEFFADKVPGVDSGWDALHSFIRIPAGAALAAGAVGPLGGEAELAAMLVGGSLAAGTHATKAGSRLLINTSPEPVTNWTASVAEDLSVIGGLWVALNYPVAFLIALVLFILIVAWLLPKIWRGIKLLACKIGQLFGKCQPESDPPAEAAKVDVDITGNLDESRKNLPPGH